MQRTLSAGINQQSNPEEYTFFGPYQDIAERLNTIGDQ
jgi:hypothetical protein